MSGTTAVNLRYNIKIENTSKAF